MHLCPSCDYENPTQLLPEFLKQLLLQPQRSSCVSSSASPCPQESLGQSDVDTGTWAVGRGIPVLGEGWALGKKQWGLSLFPSQRSQPSHSSEHARGDGAETSPSSRLHRSPPWRGPDSKAAGSLVPFGNTGQFPFITRVSCCPARV